MDKKLFTVSRSIFLFNYTYAALIYEHVVLLHSIWYLSGFPRALEIMENLENYKKKVPCMEKSWNLKKMNNHGKIMDFLE